eukprot:scaffold72828_cov69-Phaeocystis_antarctica.AAC.2
MWSLFASYFSNSACPGNSGGWSGSRRCRCGGEELGGRRAVRMHAPSRGRTSTMVVDRPRTMFALPLSSSSLLCLRGRQARTAIS